MKKFKLSISEFKKRYEVCYRKILVTVCSFTVGAYVMASPAQQPVRMEDDLPAVKTEVAVSDATVMKEVAATRILENAARNQLDVWEEAIDDVCSWPENWDEEGASAVKPGVGEAAKEILVRTKDYLDVLDNIFPTAFGSICLEWGRGLNWVNAEITADSFHLYHGNGGIKPSFIMPSSPIDPSNLDVLKTRLSILRNEINS